MSRIATGLLVIATVVFALARALERGRPVVGFVRAAAEAGMVGGLADWFAVTALFRHPLGIPIPHTALIPERKAALGAGLGAFVQENFLSPELVVAKVREAHLSHRITGWLDIETNREVVTERVVSLVQTAAQRMEREDTSRAVASIVERRLAAVPAAPLLAAALEGATADGRHHPLVDALLDHLRTYLLANTDVLRGRVARSSPWWVPGSIDDRMSNRMIAGAIELIDDVRADDRHMLRRRLDDRLALIVAELRSDPEMIEKAESWKHQALAHPAVRAWTASLWEQAHHALGGEELVSLVRSGVGRIADALQTDPDLRQRIDDGIERGVAGVVRSSGHEVADLIRTTVDRWDGADAAARIEGAVGRDLQFIRINGTVVGALAGVVIHAAGKLLG